MGAGNDSVLVQGGDLLGDVALGEGDNELILSNGSLSGSVSAGAGADRLAISGGSLTGNVDLGDGANTISVSGGSLTGNLSTGAGSDAMQISGGTVTGQVDLGSGNDRFSASGGQIVGSVFMGAGDDQSSLGGSFNPAGLAQLDGGVGTDTLSVNGLNLSAYTGSGSGGVNLTGWEEINVVGGGTLRLTGNLFESGAGAQLNIGSGSTLDLRGDSPGVFTIHGSLSNSGTVNFADGTGDDHTTIAGNYVGGSGSTILLDTVFEGDASATDRLTIQGNASGQSVLTITQIGGAGAKTEIGIPLISVNGNSPADNFSWDIGNLRVGNYQYVLQQGSAVDPNDWYLVSAVVSCEQSNTCSGGSATSSQPQKPVVYQPGSPQPLWRPAISGYSVARSMNADVGFMQTATLHQRQGDLNVLTGDQGKAWGRFLAQDLTGRGRDRFSYDQETQGVQLGHDLNNETDELGTRKRMGWLGHYVAGKTHAWDHLRPSAGLQSDTARINTTSWGFGGYRTDMKADGSYTDWVGHINQIKNDFSDSYGDKAKQKGWQLALSVERGKTLGSFDVGLNQWTLEGQGQLVLLHTRYGAFEDKYSRMKSESFDALRGRIGVRVHNGLGLKTQNANEDSSEQQGKKTQYYGVAYLVQDLIKTRKMTLAAKQGTEQDKVGERFDQTYLELGVGVQHQIGDAAWMWVDARYEAGINNRKDTAKLSLGLKKSF